MRLSEVMSPVLSPQAMRGGGGLRGVRELGCSNGDVSKKTGATKKKGHSQLVVGPVVGIIKGLAFRGVLTRSGWKLDIVVFLVWSLAQGLWWPRVKRQPGFARSIQGFTNGFVSRWPIDHRCVCFSGFRRLPLVWVGFTNQIPTYAIDTYEQLPM